MSVASAGRASVLASQALSSTPSVTSTRLRTRSDFAAIRAPRTDRGWTADTSQAPHATAAQTTATPGGGSDDAHHQAPAALARHGARPHLLGDLPPAACLGQNSCVFAQGRREALAERKRSTAGETISLTKAVKSSPAQRALIGSRLVSFMPGSVLISSKNGSFRRREHEVDARVVAAAARRERRLRRRARRGGQGLVQRGGRKVLGQALRVLARVVVDAGIRPDLHDPHGAIRREPPPRAPGRRSAARRASGPGVIRPRAASSPAMSPTTLRPTLLPSLLGLTTTRVPSRRSTSPGVGFVPPSKAIPSATRTPLADDGPLGEVLVHGEPAGGGVAARIGAAGRLDQALHPAVLAEGAVERREDHLPRGVVSLGEGVRGDVKKARRERPGEGQGARLPRAERDLALGGSPASEDGDHRAAHSTSLHSFP